MDKQPGCWNCSHYDHTRGACTTRWNNLDESYYNPATDNRQPGDFCAEHRGDPGAVWEDYFGFAN